MKYILLLISSIFFFTACSTKQPVTEYRIYLKTDSSKVQKTRCKDKTLKIYNAFSSNSLNSLQMNYVENNLIESIYSQSQWAQIPSKVITLEVLKELNKLNIFKSVQLETSRSESDLLLEINIEDFMQYFIKGNKESYVKAIINFTLIDTNTRSVLFSKTFVQKIEAQPNAKGGVVALSKALKNILIDSGKWLKESCQ